MPIVISAVQKKMRFGRSSIPCWTRQECPTLSDCANPTPPRFEDAQAREDYGRCGNRHRWNIGNGPRRRAWADEHDRLEEWAESDPIAQFVIEKGGLANGVR